MIAYQVDTHVHVGPPRYERLADYWPTLEAAGTSDVVLVQPLANYDNADVLDDAAREEVVAAVVAVDFDAENASTALSRLAADPKVRGLRLSPDGRWDDPADRDLWPTIQRLGLAVSIPSAPQRVISGDVERLVVRRPEIRFRLEHVGGIPFGTATTDAGCRAVLALHGLPNVGVMWSGFFHNAGSPYPYEAVHAYLELVLNGFGAERISWSGDVNRTQLGQDDYARDTALLDVLPFLSTRDRRTIRQNAFPWRAA